MAPKGEDRPHIAVQQNFSRTFYAVRQRSGALVGDTVDTQSERFARSAFAPGNAYLSSARKRTLDIIGALTLLLLLAPLLVMVALLIRMTSRGPVLFRQQRCGADMKPFVMLKFRSMYVATEGDEFIQQATRADPRVTPMGRVLRRTSIDELPQLINVLRNEMSLIGPRPHATSHDEFYGERIASYPARFGARPGLSGLAQVSGARGATPELSDMERRVLLDLEYLRSASLKTDIGLVAATVREMLFSSSAY